MSITSFFLFLSQIIAIDSTWSQTDWTPDGQYSSATNIDDSVAGQISLSQSPNWFNTDWQYRKKITFDNSAQTENLTNFPMLVKLDSGSDIDYAKTQNAGQDIRFTDSDGTTLIPYEIESWDEGGSSYVWVKVPQIDGSSSTDHIYLYYGNAGATDGQSATSVWTDNYTAVWHLKENPSSTAPQMKDSTANALHGTSGGVLTVDDILTGKINGALDFDTGDYINIGDQPLLELTVPFTISAWLNIDVLPSTDDFAIIDKRSNTSGWEWTWQMGSDVIYFYKQNASNQGAYFGSIPISAADIGNWMHVMITIDGAGNHASYKNGVQTDSGTLANTGFKASTGTVWIGGMNYYTFNKWYDGKIDEVTVASTNRSADWAKASYLSQSDALNTFNSEEGLYSTSGSLTSSIFDTTQTSDWGTLTYVTSGTGTVSVKVRSGNSSDLSDADDFSSCSAISSEEDISANSCVTDTERYLQYQILLEGSGISTPTVESVSITYSLSDIVAPAISAVNSVPVTDGGTITWTTDEEASSQIEYGLTTSYGTSTAITDTSPRVTDHTVTLSSLKNCTIYHYVVRSTDAAGNTRTSSDNTFTTSGCSGSATVESYETAPVTTADGGQVALVENNSGVTLAVPSDYSSEDLTFQVKKLEQNVVLTSISKPEGYQAAANATFEFNAFSDVNTVVTSFDKPLTLTFSYTEQQISGLQESTLKLYHWNGTFWQQLPTTIDTSSNTATAEISSFSIYSLFGQQSSSSSSSTASTSTTQTPSCQKPSPGAKAPWLYGAISHDSNSIILYFAPADNPVDHYVLSYGTKSGEYSFGTQDMNVNSREQMIYTVNSLSPNTTYYFRIRGGNGCAAGDWSNEISATTHGLVSFNKINIQESEVISQPKKCDTYTVKEGDTLWSIAKSELGDGSRFEELIEGNQYTYPALQSSINLRIGWKLKINCGEELQEGVMPESYDVTITVVDTEKNPIKGATVTLHSVPRTTKTDENGIATFKQVEQGNHRVVIAYDDFEGEQSINLSGEVREFNLKITVEQKKVLFSGVSLWIIGILIALLLGITTLYMRDRKLRSY